MCSKRPEDSDESQPSLIDTDALSQRSESPIHTEINSSTSLGNSLSSPSSSSSSSPPTLYCDTRHYSKNRDKCEDDCLTSAPNDNSRDQNQNSVSSSPEAIFRHYHHQSKDSVREGSNSYNNCQSHNQQFNVPRTVPCIVLSPSAHHQFFNPNLYNSPLIMPLPMFQSSIMSKMNALSSKNVDLGMQRFRDFCVDQNSNIDITNTNNRRSYEHETVIKRSSTSDALGQRQEKASECSDPVPKRLSFGIDRILSSDENLKPENLSESRQQKGPSTEVSSASKAQSKDPISKGSPTEPPILMRQPILHQNHHHHQQNHNHQQQHPLHQNLQPHHHHLNSNNHTNSASHNNIPINLSRCNDCYLLGRYCRSNSGGGGGGNNLQYSSLVSSTTTPGGSANGVSAHFSPWMANAASIYENSPLLSPSAYHAQSALSAAYGMGTSSYTTMSSLVSCNTSSGGRRKRSWSRAVFSSLQRKGLEKRFQIQKYITKPDRRQLAATLGLTDAQVKVWFQNRRMKWRHSKEGKVTSGVGDDGISTSSTNASSTPASVKTSITSVTTSTLPAD